MDSLLRSKLEALRDRCIRRAGQDAEDCEHAAWMEAHSDIADELHAILAEPEPSPWQPIATAPNDGTYALVVVDYDVTPRIAKFHPSGWRGPSGLLSRDPTHWMPLPEPPK